MKALAQAGPEGSDYTPRLHPRIGDQKTQRLFPEKGTRNCVMLARANLAANPVKFVLHRPNRAMTTSCGKRSNKEGAGV